MQRAQECELKLQRLRQFLRQAGLNAVLLHTRNNFAWLTAGGLSYISTATEMGVGSLLVTADKWCLLTNNIESQRFVEEELAGLNLEVAEYPWYQPDGEHALLRKIVSAGGVGVDVGPGQNVGREITALRNPLTPPEIKRYREHGKLSTQLTEAVCRRIESGMSEFDVVRMLHEAFAPHNVRLPVILIAADKRIDLRRHPIAEGVKIKQRVMVVVCAEFKGLWINLTRLVNFKPPNKELQRRHRAVCEVDAVANGATRPGKTLGDVFGAIVDAYAAQGFPGEWKLHHQGGSTGYLGRDVFAHPGNPTPIVADQAFAWNPSVTGTKCEDTILVRDKGFEFLTEPGPDWPAVVVQHDGSKLRRADILVCD